MIDTVYQSLYHLLVPAVLPSSQLNKTHFLAFFSPIPDSNTTSDQMLTEEEGESEEDWEQRYIVWQMYHHLISYCITTQELRETAAKQDSIYHPDSYWKELIQESLGDHLLNVQQIRYQMLILRCFFAIRR